MGTSKQLITALEKSDWLDRVLIFSAFAFFILVVLFIVKQRILDRSLRVALWWTRFLPDFSGDAELLRMEKGSVVMSSSISTTSAIVSSTLSTAAAVTSSSFSASPPIPVETPSFHQHGAHYSLALPPLSLEEDATAPIESGDGNADPPTPSPIHVEL